MPIPLPGPEKVNLTPPTAEEAQALANAMTSLIAGPDGLLPMQRALIEALFPAMTGHVVTLVDEVSGRPTPAQLAVDLAARELSFRSRVVQLTLLVAMLRHPISPDVAGAVVEYAAELGIEEGMVDVASELAAGSRDLAALDFERNGYAGNWTSQESEAEAVIHTTEALRSPWAFSEHDPELAARWAALGQLPTQSIGRKVWEMYRARGFSFPGDAGSAPPLLCQHDWVHVLADYGTTVESEVEVFGLISRANDDLHAFSLLAMVIALFETGDLAHGAGLFESSPGHFSKTPGMAERLSDAMRRGALCHDDETGSDSIDFLKLDWLSIAHRSPEDLRARFHLVDKSETARAAGSVGPWEPGGISPFQLAAGQKQAAERGEPYDAHGATPSP